MDNHSSPGFIFEITHIERDCSVFSKHRPNQKCELGMKITFYLMKVINNWMADNILESIVRKEVNRKDW